MTRFTLHQVVVFGALVALPLSGCWYTADEKSCAFIRPTWLGFKQASLLGDDDQRRIDDLVADGRFDDVEQFFVAHAARAAARKGDFAQRFADDALQDARAARDANVRWQQLQQELKQYRADCGIPEPFPLPAFCGSAPPE